MRAITRTLSLIFIFFIPWEGVVRIPGLGTAAKALGLGLALAWVATVVFTGQLRKPGAFQVAVLLFVLWNAVSIFWSADIDRTKTHLVTWVQLLGLVFILWDLYTTKSAVLAGLQAYVLGAYVAIGSAIGNFFSGDVYYTYYERFSAGDTNPDGFGFILALGIPVAWYLAGSNSETKIAPVLKFVNYVYIPAAFLGIALSGTRTAAVAAIPGMIFGLTSLTRLKIWARTLILLVLIAAIFFLLPVVQPLRSFQRLGTTVTDLSRGDLNQRLIIWEDGLESFVEHPLLGVGSNIYRLINSLGKVAHNSFLSVLVELGLIGFALFGTIIAIAVIRTFGQPKWDSRFWLAVLTVWGIGASTLTWEYRKQTWLFLSLIISSASLSGYRGDVATLGRQFKPEFPIATYLRRINLAHIVVGLLLVATVISLLILPGVGGSAPDSSGPSVLRGFLFPVDTAEHSPTPMLSELDKMTATPVQTQQRFNVRIPGNCTFGKDKWLTYSELWPVKTIEINNLRFSHEGAISLLSQEPRDVSILLQQQLVVYFLNVNQGANPKSIEDTVVKIQALLGEQTKGGRFSEAQRLRGLALAKALRDFNEGVSGPRTCPDFTKTPTPYVTLTPAPANVRLTLTPPSIRGTRSPNQPTPTPVPTSQPTPTSSP